MPRWLMPDASGAWMNAVGQFQMVMEWEELELASLVRIGISLLDAAPALMRRRGLRPQALVLNANQRVVVPQLRR